MKEKLQPPIKQERPKRDTDYPRRHCGLEANLKRKEEAQREFEETQRWFELEGRVDTLNLGS